MNASEAKALGQRAVATGLWVNDNGLWPQGAIDSEGRRCLASIWQDGPLHTWCLQGTRVESFREYWPVNAWPDFRDNATRGCLLGRLREFFGDDFHIMGVYHHQNGLWWRASGYSTPHKGWATEIESLVATLEVAAETLKDPPSSI